MNRRLVYLLEYWLVPVILVSVALLQIYLAHTANLTPWKGGGFGMFAAIDSPSMRVIWSQGLTKEGEVVNLDISRSLDVYTLRRLRALPQDRDLEQIAPELLGKSIVPTSTKPESIYNQLQKDNPNLQPNDLSLYRLKSSSDDTLGKKPVKVLVAVRLQWWRLRFDHKHHRLWSESLGKVVETGLW